MSEQIKLSKEEVQTLSQLQSDQQTLINSFGEVEMRIQLAEIKKDSLVEALTSLKNKEEEVGKTLQDKYGNGTIDLESGIFTKTE
tara:strand:- start:47 stop:301 length:255 start_codon:yes stop_codon:yes gene_type:complete